MVRDWFSPSPGYVLDFSNKSFREFFEDHFEVNIYADAFSEIGTSKYNRMRSFIGLSPPHIVVELLKKLWAKRTGERDSELEIASANWRSDYFDPEYVAALQDAAAREDEPFQALINEIGLLPSHSAASHLRKKTDEWTLDTLNRDIDRGLKNIDTDPEASITAACSIVESVCRSIILGRNENLPKAMDIQSLYKAAREPLGLSPSKDVKDDIIEADVRTILAALGNTVQGIGALRSHAGSAHGRERGYRRVDSRIARLSLYSAFTAALFLVETWEKRFPEDRLLAK